MSVSIREAVFVKGAQGNEPRGSVCVESRQGIPAQARRVGVRRGRRCAGTQRSSSRRLRSLV